MEKWFDKKFKLGLDDNKLNELLERLAETPNIIENLVKDLPEEVLNNKMNEKWSIKENIGHLIELEALHSVRLDDFITNKEMLSPADLQNKKTDDANYNKKNIDEIISDFKDVRKDFVSKLNSLSGDVLNRKSLHPRLKQEMRPVDMAYFVAEHDDHHINTIKELIKRSLS